MDKPLTNKERDLINQVNRKVKRRVLETFQLYLKCNEHFPFSGHDFSLDVISHSKGIDALKAFNAVDSMGINPPCCESDLLAKAWSGKAALNLQIKMWASGILDGISALHEFQLSYDWLPEWVWYAVRGQTKTACKFDWYYKLKFNSISKDALK